MANKKRNGPAANGAEGSAAVLDSTVLLPQNAAAGNNRAVITSLTRGPGGKADWYVTIDGICVDEPMRDRRLRNYRRFCNVIRFRFGITLAPMSQATWSAIVATAKGGAS